MFKRLSLTCACLGLILAACGDPSDRDRGDNGTPENNTPGNNTPGNNTPGNNTPGNNTPGNNTPGNNSPGNNHSGTGSFCDLAFCELACETDACYNACYADASVEAGQQMRELDGCIDTCFASEDEDDIDACVESQCGAMLDEYDACFGGELEPGDVTCAAFHGCYYECWGDYETCQQACGEDEECLDECDTEYFFCSFPCYDLTDEASDLAMELLDCHEEKCAEFEEDLAALKTCEQTECADQVAACLADQ
jgi:hypothetical protein